MPLATDRSETIEATDVTERVACGLCGRDDTRLLFVGRDRMHGRPGEFNVVQCRRCSLVYLNPRPTWDEMQKFYPVDYAGHGFRDGSHAKQLIRRGGLHKKRQLVRRRKLGGALLDVGCGNGDFLHAMSLEGNWTLFGVEPDAEAASCAAQASGSEVFCARVEDVEHPPCSFDVVTMWHVLEHLYNPNEALTSLRRTLKPDGVLLVAVPVLDSVDARLFGPHWVGYDVPRHLFTYSVTTLSQMLASAGFSPTRVETFIGGHDAFCISLAYWAEERVKWRSVLDLVRSASQSVVSRVAMAPYYAVTKMFGRGSTVVATASRADLAGHPVDTKSARAFSD